MVEKIREILVKYRDVLVYLIFGGLTTAVNCVVYLPCHYFLHFSASVSTVIAWVAAVAFAFLTNKPFVFQSHDWSAATVLRELGGFVGCRIGSGVLETLILFVTVDLLHMNGIVWKVAASILVIILNYFASKFLVFRKK